MAREQPSNTAARRRVHPLRCTGGCAAPDTAVPASTRLALQARGGGHVSATRLFGRGRARRRGASPRGTLADTSHVVRPPGQTRPLQARADRFTTTLTGRLHAVAPSARTRTPCCFLFPHSLARAQRPRRGRRLQAANRVGVVDAGIWLHLLLHSAARRHGDSGYLASNCFCHRHNSGFLCGLESLALCIVVETK